MKFFIDTEFISDGKTIDPISIGIVCENDKAIYAEFAKADLSKASPWVQENVLPHLRGAGWMLGPIVMRQGVLDFITRNTPEGDVPEFWGDYCAFDFVILSQIFGTFDTWPHDWPFFMHDLQQHQAWIGIVAPARKSHHEALDDARIIKEQWEWIAGEIQRLEAQYS